MVLLRIVHMFYYSISYSYCSSEGRSRWDKKVPQAAKGSLRETGGFGKVERAKLPGGAVKKLEEKDGQTRVRRSVSA